MRTKLKGRPGGHGLRRGVREETRYAYPPCLHAGATAIAAASPVVATVVMICAALLAA